MKRVAFAAVVGVVVGEEDDDGESVMKEYRKQEVKGVELPQQQKSVESRETLTRTEIEQLEDELDGFSEFAEAILRQYSISTIADLPRARFKHIITKVRENKNVRTSGQ